MNPVPLARELAITVGVYDESELVGCGVDALLNRDGNTAEVVRVDRAADDPGVDVVICDPMGRDLELEEYLKELAESFSGPFIVFTWNTRPSSVRRSLAAGALGFVSKAASGTELVAAVAAVHRGETVAPHAGRRGTSTGTAELSTREAEVLDLICRGMSNREIAEQLFVSVNSIKTYIRQIYQKTGVSRRAQAVAWGLAHGY